jgi:hypothetical protein
MSEEVRDRELAGGEGVVDFINACVGCVIAGVFAHLCLAGFALTVSLFFPEPLALFDPWNHPVTLALVAGLHMALFVYAGAFVGRYVRRPVAGALALAGVVGVAGLAAAVAVPRVRAVVPAMSYWLPELPALFLVLWWIAMPIAFALGGRLSTRHPERVGRWASWHGVKVLVAHVLLYTGLIVGVAGFFLWARFPDERDAGFELILTVIGIAAALAALPGIWGLKRTLGWRRGLLSNPAAYGCLALALAFGGGALLRERVSLKRERLEALRDEINAELAVPETQNGAPAFVEAVGIFKEAARKNPSLLSSVRDRHRELRWRSTGSAKWERCFPEWVDFFNDHGRALDLLAEAARAEEFLIPVAVVILEHDEHSGYLLMPEIGREPLFHALQMLRCRIDHDFAGGHFESALKYCDVMYRMSRVEGAMGTSFHQGHLPYRADLRRREAMKWLYAIVAAEKVSVAELARAQSIADAWAAVEPFSMRRARLAARCSVEAEGVLSYRRFRAREGSGFLSSLVVNHDSLCGGAPEWWPAFTKADSLKELYLRLDKRSAGMGPGVKPGTPYRVAAAREYALIVASQWARALHRHFQTDRLLGALRTWIAARRYLAEEGALPEDWDDLAPAYLASRPLCPTGEQALRLHRARASLAITWAQKGGKGGPPPEVLWTSPRERIGFVLEAPE